MSQSWDVIVIGLGGMGLAALHEFAARGTRVLGIEQFEIAHNRGSSHGETRVIRQAYFEHQNYVPLLKRSYELWDQYSSQAGTEFFHKVGLFLTGPAGSEAVDGTIRSAQIHHLELARLTPEEARDRFPRFHFEDHFETVFEPTAGYVLVEPTLRFLAEHSSRLGAKILERTPIRRIQFASGSIRIETGSETFHCDRVVLTAGPWTNGLLNSLGPEDEFASKALPITLRRKTVFWFRDPASGGHEPPVYFFEEILDSGATGSASVRKESGGSRPPLAAGVEPAFFFDLPEGQFYGFPPRGGEIKIAEHTGGEEFELTDLMREQRRAGGVSPRIPDEPVAGSFSREVTPEDSSRVSNFLKKYHLNPISLQPTRQSVCIYSMTPDGHFLIERHPAESRLVLAAGFSGHGFKFIPVIGEALADLTIQGTTKLPIDFLSTNRFKT